MSRRNSLATIGEEHKYSNSSTGLYGSHSDAKSVESAKDSFGGQATPSLISCDSATTTSYSSPPVTEAVLELTDDVFAIAKKLYTLVDSRYAEEGLLEVPVADEFDGADCLDGASSLTKVAAAKQKLKQLRARLNIARSQVIVAENRVKLAQAQVSLLEDRVNAQIDALEATLGQ